MRKEIKEIIEKTEDFCPIYWDEIYIGYVQDEKIDLITSFIGPYAHSPGGDPLYALNIDVHCRNNEEYKEISQDIKEWYLKEGKEEWKIYIGDLEEKEEKKMGGN